MKYTAISVFCLALAGIIVIYQFRPSTNETAITSRKVPTLEQKKYEFKPNVNDNIIHPISIKSKNNAQISVQNKIQTERKDDINTVKTKPLSKTAQITNDNIVEFAKKLRTTYVDGIYCQQVADDGTYRHQKHYFYNQKTEQFVEIPNVYFINSLESLGDLKDEFLRYGSKTDEITYKGQHIKIWTMK